jgi:predicted nucleic acid-binding protein
MTTALSGSPIPACVVDASVVVKVLVPEDDSDLARALIGGTSDNGSDVRAVPSLLYLECANALWKLVRRGLLPAEDARPGVRDVLALPLQVWRAEHLAEAALELALTHDITAYDAAYLALSDLLTLPLVSADERFIRKAGGPNDRLVFLSSLRPRPNGNSRR